MSTFVDRFSDGAQDYAARRPAYPDALADYLAGTVVRSGLAWEAGCGSGQLSVLLAERFERVIATDASAGQLAHARPHPRIEYRKAAAESSGLPDHVADLCVAAQAAHWFDFEAYFAEVRRVARPGGVVALTVYGIHTAGDQDVDRIVDRFYHDTLRPFWAAERRHVESGYLSLPFPFEEMESPPLEMRADWALAELLGYIATWSATQSLMKSEGRAPFESLGRELTAVWGPPETVRTIRWPLSMRVGSCR